MTMTRKQAELWIEIAMLVAMIAIFIFVSLEIVEPIVFVTGNMAIVIIGMVHYKLLDMIDRVGS